MDSPTDAWQVAAGQIIDAGAQRFDPTALEMAVQRSMLLGPSYDLRQGVRARAPHRRRVARGPPGASPRAHGLGVPGQRRGAAARPAHGAAAHRRPGLRRRRVPRDGAVRHGAALRAVATAVILGVDTPAEALADSVASLHPGIATGLSATQAHPKEQFAQVADAVCRRRRDDALDRRPRREPAMARSPSGLGVSSSQLRIPRRCATRSRPACGSKPHAAGA
ncbi:MAG: hypothetical protein R3F43_29315 [bacterium]